MQISLGTGLAAGLRRRGRPPAPSGAPILLRPPALVGTGRIGSPLAADPGDWTGALLLEFAWLRDGAAVAGATGAVYAPDAADDRAALACRITAVGAAGRAVAETPAIAAVFPHPLPVGALPDLVFTQGTGPHIMDVSPFFSGSALAFSVSGDGVAIDPATGLATIRAEALLSGAAILVVAENSGGRAELRFSLKVTPAVAPILLTAPTISGAGAGAGRVGAELVADPGVWAGEPAPELTLQWLCDDAPVAGATGDRFTPGDAEDGAAVAVEVTARNAAGTLAARSDARGITRAAPVATGGVGDVVLARGGDAGLVPAAGAFAGAALRFAVAGAGVTIDPATGVVTIPTGARRAAETVTVTATNSGGSATVAFAVRVLAAPAASGAPEAAVFALGAAAGTVAVAGFFSGDALVFALDAGPAGVTIDPATGLVTVPTGAALAGAVVVRASNAVGSATLEFAVTVLAATTAAMTVFDAPEKLAEVSFVQRNAVPSWSYDAAAGSAVFSPGAPSDFTHGAWARARGDGRYRALVRISHSAVAPATYTRSRPFGLNGRMARDGADMRGVRVELDRRVDGTTAFEIREYAGRAEEMTLIGGAPVAWAYDVWYWMETEFAGPTVRARLYPATEAAPAWQATATTTALGAGYFGPMSHVFATAIFPIIHIQRLEHHPLAATGPAPRLTGTIPAVRASVGGVIRVDVGAAVEGADLSWSAAVDGADLPAGWAISPEGVLTAPTGAAFASRSVAVTATDAFGRSVTATFQVAVEPAAPRLTGALADVTATVGDVVRVDFGAIVTGTGLAFTVDRPWAIDARGVLTVPTAAPLQGAVVTVTATDALARAVSDTFLVTVKAVAPPPAPVLTAPLGAVTATIGEARTVDVGARVTPKAGLTWTTNRPTWALSAAGVLTIPTTAVLAAAAVTVTATDAFGQSVTATFQVAVVAAPMTLTTAPTFASASGPGTALGSVWNIAGGAYAGGVAPFTVERRFLRDGVAIGAYGAATAHTIVAADQGKTITAQLRRTDSAVPPQVLTVAAAGAAVIPAAPTPGLKPDFTVTTTAQLLAAMITAAGQAGPKVIACNPGRYLGGITRLNALVKAGRAADGTNLNNRVTITSADRRNPATFIDKGFEMSFADGFTFDGLTFQNTREDAQGWPAGDNAFQMKDCANITVRNCTFSDWQDACNCTRGRNYTFEWNRWQRQGKDSCRFFDRNVNVLVQNNTFTTPRVDVTRAQEGPRHPDFLSLQLAAPAQRGNVNVAIRRNFFSGHNHYHQGIFMPNDEALTTGNYELYKHVGVTITENWLILAHVNTLLVAGAEDVLVNRNVVRTFGPGFGKPGIWDPGTKVQPKVTFGQVVKGVCRDNVGPWAVGVTNLDAAKSDLARINNIADPSETVTPPGMTAPYPNGPYAYE